MKLTCVPGPVVTKILILRISIIPQIFLRIVDFLFININNNKWAILNGKYTVLTVLQPTLNQLLSSS